MIICTLSCHWTQPYWQPSIIDWRECDVFVPSAWLENLAALFPFSMPQAERRARYGPHTLSPKRPHKSVIVSRSPCVSQVPMVEHLVKRAQDFMGLILWFHVSETVTPLKSASQPDILYGWTLTTCCFCQTSPASLTTRRPDRVSPLFCPHTPDVSEGPFQQRYSLPAS